MIDKNQKDKINSCLETVSSLFNCKGANTYDTQIFRKVSHETLCQAFQYWLEEMRTTISEPTSVAITQSLRDDGIDVLLEFSKSEVKVGFQIKSCNDVDEKEFTSKCIAQISRSRKHSISRLIIAIGADLTNERHQQKVRGLTSEISEMDNFCKVFSPEKTLTIWQTFENKEHPIGQTESLGAALNVIQALRKSLSSDPYYKHDIVWKSTLKEKKPQGKKRDIEFKLVTRLRPGTKNILDALKESSLTGNSFTIPAEDVEKFQIRKNGKIIEKNKKGSLTIVPKKQKISLTLETIERTTGSSLTFENLLFVVDSVVGKTIHLSTHEDCLPYRFKFSMENEQVVGNISASIKGSVNVAQRYKLVRFIAALGTGSSFFFKDSNGDTIISGKPRNVPEQPKELIETLAQLNFIQEKTGIEIYIPKNVTHKDMKDLVFAYTLLSTGVAKVNSLEFSSTFEKAQVTDFLKNFEAEDGLKNSTLNNFPIEIELFGKKMPVGLGSYQIPTLILSNGLAEVKRQLSQLKEEDTITISCRNSPDCSVVIKLNI